MKPRFYVFVNGILNLWNTNTAFTDNAVRYVMTHTRHRADKFEAPITIFSASWKQRERVAAFRKWLEPYAREYNLYLVGHSWGARIITDYLAASSDHIKAIYLIAAACDEDCRKNALNFCAGVQRFDHVHITVSNADAALKLAKTFGWIAGYGCLGLVGPKSASRILLDRMTIHDGMANNLNHREWWDEKHFLRTMDLILA